MIPQLLPLEPSGCKSDQEIIDMGFDSTITIDPQNNEAYYQLYKNDEHVGDTEYNDNYDEYEIICYDEKSFDIVKSIVGNKVNVWAWYDNVFTNVN